MEAVEKNIEPYFVFDEDIQCETDANTQEAHVMLTGGGGGGGGGGGN